MSVCRSWGSPPWLGWRAIAPAAEPMSTDTVPVMRAKSRSVGSVGFTALPICDEFGAYPESEKGGMAAFSQQHSSRRNHH